MTDAGFVIALQTRDSVLLSTFDSSSTLYIDIIISVGGGRLARRYSDSV